MAATLVAVVALLAPPLIGYSLVVHGVAHERGSFLALGAVLGILWVWMFVAGTRSLAKRDES